jgi:hypothetical protein
VLSVDYLRILGLHSIMPRYWNRVGAADTLNVANARAAMDATHGALGCPSGPAGVICAIAAGAAIESYAANGLGRGEAATPTSRNPFGFPGLTSDFNGDGTYGDPLPGTLRGSFGRGVGDAAALNRVIDAHNATQAGQLTPAGKALVNAGLFTEAQLKALGAASPEVVRAPQQQVNLDSFITTDLRLARPFKLRGERIKIEPALEIFNLFNIANYDLPGNKLGATLTGATGSINGTTAADRPNRAGFGSGSFALGISRAWQLALHVSF